MGICKDKTITYLKRLGYNVVRHPRADIQPLELIGQQRDAVAPLGKLDRLITNPPGPLPEPTLNQPASNLGGQESSSMSAGIGLNVLGNFIGAMGGNLGVKAKYQQARRIQFQFNDVLTDSVMPLDVGNYLREGEVDADNLVLKQYVLGNGRLYLITKTVRTRQFTVKAERKDGTEVSLDIPAIQEVLGGEISVAAESERASVITYQGPEYLVFGFQAFLVGVENGDLTMVSAEPGHVALEATSTGAVAQGEPAILSDGALVDFVSEEELART